jgi:hypothetical protein
VLAGWYLHTNAVGPVGVGYAGSTSSAACAVAGVLVCSLWAVVSTLISD